jgi:uncharacterized membrane protein HdeD (DUF308 family)
MTTAVVTQSKQRPWWLTLLTGILAVLVGGLMLWGTPQAKIQTYQGLILILGVWWVVQGFFDIVAIFVDKSMWGWKLFMGIISIAAGSYILRYPLVSAIAVPKILVLVMGIWGLMYGIMLLVMAFSGGGWGAAILGVLGIIFGVALMVNYSSPGMGLAMLWTAAVFAVIGGIAMIFQGFRQRTA